jgi:signal peptidase I
MARKAKETKRKKSIVREYAEIIIIAVLLALFVRTFFAQAFKIPSPSMEDTLLVGDFLFANKLVYGAKIPFINKRLPAIRKPQRGDIIIFKWPGDMKTPYIKRCVAIAGQTVEVRDKTLYVDGVPQKESYTKYISGMNPLRKFGPFKVPEGHIFMMGDNRDNSSDSRVWGPLDTNLIMGKAMFIYFSWSPKRHMVRFSRIGDVIR